MPPDLLALAIFANEKSFLRSVGARVSVTFFLPDLRAVAASRTACCSGIMAATSDSDWWEPTRSGTVERGFERGDDGGMMVLASLMTVKQRQGSALER